MALIPQNLPLVSCYAYCGGYRWHWRQTHDSFPGQPVVLVHGLASGGGDLVPLAGAITGWAPVLVPDLPGFGLSAGRSQALDVGELAAALAEWMRVAGAVPAHVVGNSFGSQIAVELAARYPQQVRSLTLVGPTIDPEARGLYSQMSRLFAELRLEPRDLWLLRAGRAGRYARGDGLKQALGTLRALLRDRIETKFPHIKAPTLILRGLDDPISPELWTRRAAQLIPNARSISLTDGGHCVHFSHPALVACALRKFTFPLRNNPAR